MGVKSLKQKIRNQQGFKEGTCLGSGTRVACPGKDTYSTVNLIALRM